MNSEELNKSLEILFPLVQQTDQVDFLVEEKKNSLKSNVVNNVAMVVPAATLIPTDKGEIGITLKNTSDEPVLVWFPQPWFSKDDKDDPVTNPITIDARAKVVVKVDKELVGAPKIRPFQVWASTINEFAVGDSPPKMVLHP